MANTMKIQALTLGNSYHDFFCGKKTKESDNLAIRQTPELNLNYKGPVIVCGNSRVFAMACEFESDLMCPLIGKVGSSEREKPDHCRWMFGSTFSIKSVIECPTKKENRLWIPSKKLINNVVQVLKKEYPHCSWDALIY